MSSECDALLDVNEIPYEDEASVLLVECRLTAAAVSALGRNARLTKLSMAELDLSVATPSLFQSLQHSSSLQYLVLEGCVLGNGATLDAMCRFLETTASLACVDVFNNNFGMRSQECEYYHSVDLMRAFARCRSLRTLNWHVDGEMSDVHVAALATSSVPPNTVLRELSLLWTAVEQRSTLPALFDALPMLDSFEFSLPRLQLSEHFFHTVDSLLSTTTRLTKLALNEVRMSWSLLERCLSAASRCSALKVLELRRLSDGEEASAAEQDRARDGVARSLIDLLTSRHAWRLHSFELESFTVPARFSSALLAALADNARLTQLGCASHVDDAVTAQLSTNVRSHWFACHQIVASIALGLAPLSWPVYVVLEVIDSNAVLLRARHGYKIAALILVKRAFDAKAERMNQTSGMFNS